MNETPIGYVCGKGHYQFFADPEGWDYCSSKKVGDIYVRWSEDAGRYGQTHEQLIEECDESLTQKYEAWRKS